MYQLSSCHLHKHEALLKGHLIYSNDLTYYTKRIGILTNKWAVCLSKYLATVKTYRSSFRHSVSLMNRLHH